MWIDNEHRGPASGVFTLPAVPHIVEIRKEGYAGFHKTVVPQPGLTQQIKVELLTLAEARLERLKAVRTTGQGHKLVLLSPTKFQMGALPPGARSAANEVIRTVDLTRLFYLSRHEVTNGQFRAFASGHLSGQFENRDLDRDNQPVVEVSWHEAALYCNWLSEQDDLEPFYQEEFGKAVGFNPTALGYRLPTEAEWPWTARYVGETKLLRFPGGSNCRRPTSMATTPINRRRIRSVGSSSATTTTTSPAHRWVRFRPTTRASTISAATSRNGARLLRDSRRQFTRRSPRAPTGRVPCDSRRKLDARNGFRPAIVRSRLRDRSSPGCRFQDREVRGVNMGVTARRRRTHPGRRCAELPGASHRTGWSVECPGNRIGCRAGRGADQPIRVQRPGDHSAGRGVEGR